MSQTPRRSNRQGGSSSRGDAPSSDVPSSPRLAYPSSPAAASSPAADYMDASLPFEIQHRPGSTLIPMTPRNYATPGRYAATPRSHLDTEVSSPLPYPSSSRSRGGLSSSGLRSDLVSTPLNPRVAGLETPRRGRGDVVQSPQITRGLARREPASEIASSQPFASSQAHDPSEAVKVVWGTSIDIDDVILAFKDFLLNFKQKHRLAKNGVTEITPTQNEPFYPQLLRQVVGTGSRQVNLDCQNLAAYPPAAALLQQLENYPAEILPLMDFALNRFYQEQELDADQLMEGEPPTENLMIRPFNLGKVCNTRELGPQDIDRLVTVKGLMLRTSNVIPNVKTGFFQCLVCDYTMTASADRGRITEPTKCPRTDCGALNSMSLIHNRNEFTDKQVCRMQELPESIPDGQTPQSISLVAHDDLVDVCKPGDRLEVTAVFRGVPVRVNPKQRTLKNLYKTYLDVVHIKKSSKERLAIDSDIETQPGRNKDKLVYDGGDDLRVEDGGMEAKVLELSQIPNLYETLARSVAPSIFEHDDIKKGVLLQLFGGTNKTFEKAGSPRYRGDINVLLVGDPGTSKSQILTYVHKIAPRGVYTSGKGSSAVGLTAYVTRDPDTRQLVLESGALVLSDGGVCCIDEFDKMSDATRSVLHEVMEQQTVSVAKAGIITTLNARTSLLAAANPIGSQYNHRLPMVDNIDLPPTLISRFDLLYLVLDIVSESSDRRLARHIIGMYNEDAPQTGGYEIIPIEMLTAYISYARQHCKPILSEEAGQTLVGCYQELRRLGGGKQITATTRQLESMIRLSEARAKLRLSTTVEREDVEEASRLIREGLKQSAMDPRTGMLDMDLLTTGQGTYDRGHFDNMRRELKSLLDTSSSTRFKWSELLAEFNAQSSVAISEEQFSKVLDDLEQQLYVKVTGKRGARMVQKLGTGQDA